MGVGLMLGMLYVCFYTANLLVKIPALAGIVCDEFSDMCGQLLGRWARVLCEFTSQVSLLGTCIVYWILMTNFLFHIVSYCYELAIHNATITFSMDPGSDDVFCTLKPTNANFSALLFSEDGTDAFYRLWDLQTTAPFALGIILIPMIFVKSPSVFMKFNALGTLSVVVLIGVVVMKAWKWGFFNISSDVDNIYYTPKFQWQFIVQSGVLSQALFIHNCIMTVFKLQRNPENNSRDLGIAFSLVGLTYFSIALFFYLAFPLAKDCILDNFLDNFQSSDLLAFTARVFMFFQVMCLFPLFVYMLRTQLFHVIFPEDPDPTFLRLCVNNIFLVAICVVFAIYIPKIGTVIRFVGS